MSDFSRMVAIAAFSILPNAVQADALQPRKMDPQLTAKIGKGEFTEERAETYAKHCLSYRVLHRHKQSSIDLPGLGSMTFHSRPTEHKQDAANWGGWEIRDSGKIEYYGKQTTNSAQTPVEQVNRHGVFREEDASMLRNIDPEGWDERVNSWHNSDLFRGYASTPDGGVQIYMLWKRSSPDISIDMYIAKPGSIKKIEYWPGILREYQAGAFDRKGKKPSIVHRALNKVRHVDYMRVLVAKVPFTIKEVNPPTKGYVEAVSGAFADSSGDESRLSARLRLNSTAGKQLITDGLVYANCTYAFWPDGTKICIHREYLTDISR